MKRVYYSQRQQFPELVPHAVGSEYAGITSGRVLNVKNATTSRLHQQVWDRVAAAASELSSSQSVPPAQRHVGRFPPLPGTNSAPTPAFRQPTLRTTPWSASATAGRGTPMGAVEPRNVPGPKAQPSKQARPPKLDSTLFPELPSSSNSRKLQVSGNVSLKNILGNNTPSTSAWGTSGDRSGNMIISQHQFLRRLQINLEERENKGKGKQKQTLFTLGTFPSS